MLLNIPKELTGALINAMWEMGHGSELILADANFPAVDCVDSSRIIYLPSVGNASLLSAVLKVFPLDSYEPNVIFMQPCNGNDAPVWKTYTENLQESKAAFNIAKLSREDFYVRAKKAYCVVVTGEGAPYANIILKKGEVRI